MSESEVNKLSKKMDRILYILDNDPGTGEKGLVATVEQLKIDFAVFVNQYNIDQAVKVGKATVWKIVWGSVGAGVVLALKSIVTTIVEHLKF